MLKSLLASLVLAFVVASGVALVSCIHPATREYVDVAYLQSTVVKLVPTQEIEAYGSGVVIEKHDTVEGCKIAVATAEHVVDAGPVVIKGHPEVKPFIAIKHPQQDIAVVIYKASIACNKIPLGVAELAPYGPKVLDQIIHIGFPAGNFQAAYGTFVGYELYEGKDIRAITSVAGPGSSGGAIFYKGKLVGILVMGELRPPFRNFYTPISYLNELR